MSSPLWQAAVVAVSTVQVELAPAVAAGSETFKGVAVARQFDALIAQVARDFEHCESCLPSPQGT